MDQREELKELLADLLVAFHAEKVSRYGFTVDVMKELGPEVDKVGEYGAMQAWEVIEKHVDAHRSKRS